MFSLYLSLAALQIQSAGSADRETLLVIFVGIIAFFFLALIAGLGAAAIYALKLKRDVLKAIASLKATVQEKAYPVVSTTHDLIRDLTPKIKTITENAAEISHTVRAQVTDIDSTLSDVTAKARAQADRVHGMVNSTLDTTSNVVTSVERGVRAPIREVAGVIAGIKAGWTVLTKSPEVSEKSVVKGAARHVESWEDEVASDAFKASQVNAPVTSKVAPVVPGVRSVAGEPGRSIVEAGEEVLTSASDAVAGRPGIPTATVPDLAPGRTKL